MALFIEQLTSAIFVGTARTRLLSMRILAMACPRSLFRLPTLLRGVP